MNPYTEELLNALVSLGDHSRTFRVWLKDADNFGGHEQLKEAMEDFEHISKRVVKLVPKFWAEQEKLMGDAPINIEDLSEVMM